MNLKLIISAFVITSVMFSCKFKPTENKASQYDMHNSKISLDWDGTYYGVIPCASCSGIEVTLTIDADYKFILEEKYLTDDNDTSFITKGDFEWTEDGSTIVFKNFDNNDEERVLSYKVEENRLRQLDTKGNIIEGDLASSYLLFKTGNLAIENHRWKLIELNGEEIHGDSDNFYIIFNSEERKIHAKAGCNILQFEYLIVNSYKLITKPGLTTLMACPDDVEDRLVAAITVADNITYGEKNLSLNKARMSSLARFELVEDAENK